MYYDEYLNHKSITKCVSKRDIERHDQDNNKLFALLDEASVSAGLVVARYMDEAHKGEESYHYLEEGSFREHLDAYDSKNGIDLVLCDGKVGAVVYGGNYSTGKENASGMEEVFVTYQIFDEKKVNLKNLKEELDIVNRTEDAQKILSCISKEDVFIEDDRLKEKLRSVKRLPLDVQIKNSEKIKKEQQEKKRGKRNRSRDKIKPLQERE